MGGRAYMKVVRKMEEKEMKAWTVIMDNNVQRTGSDLWKVKSSSEGDKIYSVIRWGSSDLRCDCLGFRHYSRCKHIDAVRKMVDIARTNG